jgi:hypothetical protein
MPFGELKNGLNVDQGALAKWYFAGDQQDILA